MYPAFITRFSSSFLPSSLFLYLVKNFLFCCLFPPLAHVKFLPLLFFCVPVGPPPYPPSASSFSSSSSFCSASSSRSPRASPGPHPSYIPPLFFLQSFFGLNSRRRSRWTSSGLHAGCVRNPVHVRTENTSRYGAEHSSRSSNTLGAHLE